MCSAQVGEEDDGGLQCTSWYTIDNDVWNVRQANQDMLVFAEIHIVLKWELIDTHQDLQVLISQRSWCMHIPNIHSLDLGYNSFSVVFVGKDYHG